MSIRLAPNGDQGHCSRGSAATGFPPRLAESEFSERDRLREWVTETLVSRAGDGDAFTRGGSCRSRLARCRHRLDQTGQVIRGNRIVGYVRCNNLCCQAEELRLVYCLVLRHIHSFVVCGFQQLSPFPSRWSCNTHKNHRTAPRCARIND